MVKYLDGNIHLEKDGEFLKNEHGNPLDPKFPGYSEDFYREIVKDAGDKLKVKELPKK